IDELELMGLNELADSSMVIRVRLRTLPLQQWGTGREYRKRVKKAFDRAGITIPFPQLTMHMVAENNDGRHKASAARN
ncbi:MAG: mechanosensitive ion channel family protein, partial [Candidatus Eremiobacteraeota bacterium]|nr:mechanosensitive ion channel family protein [Candidatus Eremiobacteraeota bacterium]